MMNNMQKDNLNIKHMKKKHPKYDKSPKILFFKEF